ncbi:MAG TPA: S8 family serine peptidase [Candidatus Dormibacteraeota bacterium]|nr:S8 family serine peptidase [Candidatus Dormibacteraeota bacterium]
MRKILAAFLVFSSIGLSVIALGVGGSATTRPNANADAFSQGPDVDRSSAIVQLKGDPLSIHSATKPAAGKKIDFNSNSVRSYRAQLSAGRNEFRRWLRANAPRARVTSEYDISLNGVAVELNGTPLETIAAAPMVQQVQYNALYHPNLSQSHFIINADPAWVAAGGRAMAGAGIKIGDIDTGIDNTHPFFDPTGFTFPAGFPKCDAVDSNSHHQDQDCRYVSPKVIVAKVFFNKNNQRNFDAQAIQDHGTHTAGIAAGIFNPSLNAVVNGVMIGNMSGIAPGAWLGNYNVFPGDVLNARSEDILNAVDAAVADGMDVLNLSLGGSFHGNNDLLSIGLDNAVDAGVTVAVAAGNSGPGPNTVESPGRARKVITVAASTNQHFVGQPFTYPAGGGTTIGAAVGDFAPLPATSFNLFDTHSNGCTSVDPGASGDVAIIDRGVCTFSQKVANAKAAGAIGVLIINNVAGDPIAMARTAGFDDNLPAVMIGANEGAALRAGNPPNASAAAMFQEFVTANKDILASFSGQGPTNVDLAIKPDVTSVGVNVLSSITCVGKGPACPGDGSGWAFFQGTSMSTPHIAGSAAVLKNLHPTWSPAQIKSELVNRADLVIKDSITGTHDVGPTAQGAGRENLSVAADGTTWMDPVSASFGKVTVGHPTSLNVTLTNPTGSSQMYAVSVTKFTPSTFGGTVPSVFDAGVLSSGDNRITVPSSVTVPANGSATLTVTVNSGLPLGTVIQGWIDLNSGSDDLHFAYYAQVGP